MSAGWNMFVVLLTLMSIVGVVWLLVSNRNKVADGSELDHEFDGIRELDNPLPAWWVGLFVISIIFALGYVFYYPALGNIKGASGWTSEKEWLAQTDRHDERFKPLYAQYAALSPEVLMADRKAMQTGRRLFLNYCSTCHGVTAKGGNTFPNLTDEEWMWGGSFDSIKQTITSGRNGVMPPWEQALQPDQLTALTQFVLSLSGSDSSTSVLGTGNPVERNLEAGKTAYNTYCMACHGLDGEGNTALGAPNLSNDVWLYGGSAADVSHSIAKGRGGLMPAQDQILGGDKIHLLAAYVLSLTTNDLQGVVQSTSDSPEPKNVGD